MFEFIKEFFDSFYLRKSKRILIRQVYEDYSYRTGFDDAHVTFAYLGGSLASISWLSDSTVLFFSTKRNLQEPFCVFLTLHEFRHRLQLHGTTKELVTTTFISPLFLERDADEFAKKEYDLHYKNQYGNIDDFYENWRSLQEERYTSNLFPQPNKEASLTLIKNANQNYKGI